VLCGDNVEEKLESLYDACDKKLPIPSDVEVWEKFELESCEVLIEIIEDLEIQFNEANQDFINGLLKTK